MLKFYRFVFNYRKHIIYVSIISFVQVLLILWYLNLKPKTESMAQIVKGISDLSQGQVKINENIVIIYKQLKIMSAKDSIMDDQLKHYPAALPIAMMDLTRSSSLYSERVDPITGEKRFHWGIDYTAKEGTPVYATANGKIEKANFDGDYGNIIKINHLNGYESLYAHLSEIDVSVNQNINRGDMIGTVGRTGRTTGAHLHYEVTYMEKHINPNIFRTPFKNISDEKISGLEDYKNFLALFEY